MKFNIDKLRKLQNTASQGLNSNTHQFIKDFEDYINSDEFETFLQISLTNKISKGELPKIYCGLPINKYGHNVFVICESKIVDSTLINGKVFSFWEIINSNSSDEFKATVLNTVKLCYELLVNKLEELGLQVVSKKQDFSIGHNDTDSHEINLIID